MNEAHGDLVIPVIAEELHIDAVPVKRGGVRVIKRVVQHDELIEQQLQAEHVEVRRLPINQLVDGPMQIRQEGEVTVIPVVEEILHIQRQWVLKEEIHITKRTELLDHRETVTVSHEEIELQRMEGDSDVSTPFMHDLPGL